MISGLRKRVDELLAFCSEKIEDYKFNIVWESPKKATAAVVDSVRQAGSSHSPSMQSPSSSDSCQVHAIDHLCSPLMVYARYNPSWNTANKRAWCQQMLTYYCCLKSRLNRCPQQDIQDHYQQREHYLQIQINLNCQGGIYGRTRHPTDVRCKSGSHQSNSSLSKYRLSSLVVYSVLFPIVLLFVE